MPAWPPFQVVGITHRKADLGLRERFARSSRDIAGLLDDTERAGVVLSTCNRFEVYWWGSQDWADWFFESAGGVPIPRSAFLQDQGPPAIRHLFSVAAGLDSQILGETEILGQVRRAWGLARGVSSTSRELDLIFAGAISSGRRVRRETPLGRHPASLGSVAVEVAADECGGLAERNAVVIGAGEGARAVVAALNQAGIRPLVVSRHLERAQSLAQSHSVTVESWDRLDQLLARADLVFAATSAPHAFLSSDRLGPVSSRRGRPLLVMDLGVPRNVDAGARALPRLRVLDLDDLRARGGRALELHPGLDAARLVLEREVTRLLSKLERWCAPLMEPDERPARVDSAG
jgi:glutamyl-tRNA reductase